MSRINYKINKKYVSNPSQMSIKKRAVISKRLDFANKKEAGSSVGFVNM